MPVRPLVILPGYYGSKLNLKSTKKVVWIDLKGIFQPKKVMDLLKFDAASDALYPSTILDTIELPAFFCLDFYKSLKRFLKNTVGYDHDQFVGHAVDWRQSLSVSADHLHARLTSGPLKNQKVDLLCHSHGGLVARAYLRKHGHEQIARCITLGTPHHGMLKVLEALHDGIKLHTFSKKLTKPTAITMPSAYELLPRGGQYGLFTWKDKATDPLAEPAWTEHEAKADLKEVLQKQVTAAQKTTADFLPNALPVKGYFIYGTRLDTMVNANGSPTKRLTITRAEDGDNTIARVSGLGTDMTGDITRCPAPFANHSDMFNNPYVRQILKSVLQDDQLPHQQLQVVARWERNRYQANIPHRVAVEVRDAKGDPLNGATVHLMIYRRGKFHEPMVDQMLPQSNRGDFVGQVLFTQKHKPLHYRVKIEHPDLPADLRFHRGTLRAQ